MCEVNKIKIYDNLPIRIEDHCYSWFGKYNTQGRRALDERILNSESIIGVFVFLLVDEDSTKLRTAVLLLFSLRSIWQFTSFPDGYV